MNKGLPTISNSSVMTWRTAHSAKSKPEPTCMIDIDHDSTAPNASGPNRRSPTTPYNNTRSRFERKARGELDSAFSVSGSGDVTGQPPGFDPEPCVSGSVEHRQSTVCHESHFRAARAVSAALAAAYPHLY